MFKRRVVSVKSISVLLLALCGMSVGAAEPTAKVEYLDRVLIRFPATCKSKNATNELKQTEGMAIEFFVSAGSGTSLMSYRANEGTVAYFLNVISSFTAQNGVVKSTSVIRGGRAERDLELKTTTKDGKLLSGQLRMWMSNYPEMKDYQSQLDISCE